MLTSTDFTNLKAFLATVPPNTLVYGFAIALQLKDGQMKPLGTYRINNLEDSEDGACTYKSANYFIGGKDNEFIEGTHYTSIQGIQVVAGQDIFKAGL